MDMYSLISCIPTISTIVLNRNVAVFKIIVTFFYFLTHSSPVSHFYTPWKRQESKDFLTFSGGIEMWHWTKMG